jgi:hypothetical protein
MKKLYLISILLFVSTYAFSQALPPPPPPSCIFEGENIELNVPFTLGGYIFEASESITLKPGFQTSHSFQARINRTLLFPPKNATYADADGNIKDCPSQGGIVGNIPGKFNVSPTGAATYSIPIECPAGINGMQPAVSLAYSSQSGNGIAGWGWNLGGLSMITRAPKNYFHDNEKSGIIWDNTSPYALDGNRLFIKNTYGTDSIEYYTEKEMGVRVVGCNIRHYGPQYFKIYYKDGRRAIYGGNPPSKYVLKDIISHYPHLGWALTKLTDTNGNYLEVVYTRKTGPTGLYHSHRPTKIKYGANTNASSAHFAEIEFVYETRTDVEEKYIAGEKIKQEYRLKEILSKSNGVEVNKYELAYNFAETSKLTSVAQSSNGIKKNPIVFEWENNTYNITESGNNIKMLSFDARDALSASYPINGEIIYTGDFNGDGITDFIREESFRTIHDNKPVYIQWQLYLKEENQTLVYHSSGLCDNELYGKSILILDKDSDGTDELYVRKLSGYSPYIYEHFQCFEMQNGQFSRNINKDYIFRLQDNDHHKQLFIIPGDFDGNGIPDIIALRDERYYGNAGLGTCLGFPHFETQWSSAGHEIKGVELLDFNGDGQIDILLKGEDEVHICTFNKSVNMFDCLYVSTN